MTEGFIRLKILRRKSKTVVKIKNHWKIKYITEKKYLASNYLRKFEIFIIKDMFNFITKDMFNLRQLMIVFRISSFIFTMEYLLLKILERAQLAT